MPEKRDDHGSDGKGSEHRQDIGDGAAQDGGDIHAPTPVISRPS